jgi:hypothetical protein
MPKSDLNKEILTQIEKASNPERNLGNVAIRSPKVLRYKPKAVIDNPQGISIAWQKRSYGFNRGTTADLDNMIFFNWTGILSRGRIIADKGNFTDDGFDAHANIQYAVEVFADEAATVDLKITSGQSSIAVYLNKEKVFTSGVNFFQTGNRSLSLVQGWNRIDIFYYRETSGGALKIEGDLGTYISSWRDVDFTPSQAPQWRDTDPLITEYIDTEDFGQAQNVLFWKKFPVANEEDVDTFDGENIFAWECYRSEKVPLINLAGSNVTVISGWGDTGFAVSGDLRTVIPAGNSIYLKATEDEYVVSGTNYSEDDTETRVEISGTFSSAPAASDPILIDKFKRIWGFMYDDTLPFIISGTDPMVQHGQSYKYFLKTRDAARGNRSERSIIQTIVAGDSTAPGHVTNIGNIRIFNNLMIYFNIPTDDDLAGFKVYEGAVADANLVKTVSLKSTAIPGVSYFSIQVGTDRNNAILDPQTQYTFYVTPFDYRNNENTTTPPSTSTGYGTILGGMGSFDSGDPGFFMGYDGSQHVISMGDGTSDTQSIRWDGATLVVSGGVIDQIAAESSPALQSWQFSTDFYAEDYRTVGWGAGTLTLQDGTTYSIISGNTGNMADVTYIYFDKATSQTAFQVSSTSGDAVGSSKLLITVGNLVPDATKKATFQEFGGQGSQGVFITADHIQTNSLDAGLIDVDVLSALTANMGTLTAGNITLDSAGFIRAGQTAYDTGSGFWIGYDTDAYKFSIGDGSTSLTWDGSTLTVNGSVLTSLAAGSETSIQGWQFDGLFSASDYRNINWAAGTLTLMDGTTYSISGGGIGPLSTPYYVYFDKAVSTTAFQTTGTASNTVGSGKILIAVLENNPDSSKLAYYQVFGGGVKGIHPIVSGSNIAANSISANEIIANTITANEMNVSQLSAIAVDAGSITAGSLTGLTITGGLIQTAVEGGQRIAISGADNTLRFYDPNGVNVITIDDNIHGGSEPGMKINSIEDDNQNYTTLGSLGLFTQHESSSASPIYGLNKYGGSDPTLTAGVRGSSNHDLSTTWGKKRVGVWAEAYVGNIDCNDESIGIYVTSNAVGRPGDTYAAWFESGRVYVKEDLFVTGNTVLENTSAENLTVSGTAQFLNDNFFYIERASTGLVLNARCEATSSNLFVGGEGPQTIYLTGGSGDSMRLAANSSAEHHIMINTSGDVFMHNSLTVSGTALTISHPTDPTLRLQNNIGGNPVNAGRIYFGEGVGGDQFEITHNGLTNELAFKTNTAGQVMSITRDTKLVVISGSLGIGGVPSEELHVFGKIHGTEQIRGTSTLESFPQFSKVDDTDTGVAFPAANEVSIVVSGTRRERWTESARFTDFDDSDADGRGWEEGNTAINTATTTPTTIKSFTMVANEILLIEYTILGADESDNITMMQRIERFEKIGTMTKLSDDNVKTDIDQAVGADVEVLLDDPQIHIQVWPGTTDNTRWTCCYRAYRMISPF